jgi:hypothetical protein
MSIHNYERNLPTNHQMMYVPVFCFQLSSRARQVLIYARKPLAVQNRTPALGLKTQNKAGASAERFLG